MLEQKTVYLESGEMVIKRPDWGWPCFEFWPVSEPVQPGMRVALVPVTRPMKVARKQRREAEMKVETKVNGVAVDQLMETIDLLKTQPELGEFKFRTNNRWIDGTMNRAENPAFYGAGAEDTGS